MHHFGFKIVDRSRAEVAPILDRAEAEGRPVEVGLYFGDAETLAYLTARLATGGVPVNVHLDHRRHNLFSLDPDALALHQQLDRARQLGARYVITHVSAYPMSPRFEHQQAVMRRLMDGLGPLAELCGARGMDVFIENTFHDLAFYRGFFGEVLEAGVAGAHMCFDIGHAKVWSTATFAQWLDLLQDLDRAGRRLHFHLHANGGLYDEHRSFTVGDWTGITGESAFSPGMDDYRMLAVLAQRFPSAAMVLEVPSDEALVNMEHVVARVSERMSAALDPV